MKNKKDPFSLTPDPFTGETFVLSEILCTQERRLWVRRTNEILAFLNIGVLALRTTKKKFAGLASKKETPLQIKSFDGMGVILPSESVAGHCQEGIEVLTRQVFVMMYGSWETFLFQLFDKAFSELGVTEGVLDRSIEILMKKKWDGKFNKMGDVFGVDYRAGNLIEHFKGFGMKSQYKKYTNPLEFLDYLAQIRHRIVHASSILESGDPLFINLKMFPGYMAFSYRLTDYVDELFAQRFGFPRVNVDPGTA